MNNVVLMGRLTKDVEIKYSQGVQPMVIGRFTVAVNKRKKEDGANFLNCVVFGNTAENIYKFFKKGDMICVSGSIETGSYKKQDGTTVYTTDINVNNFSFCGASGKKESSMNDFSGAVSYEEQPF